jgi:hypothetical protein
VRSAGGKVSRLAGQTGEAAVRIGEIKRGA